MDTKEQVLEELKVKYPEIHQAIQDDGGECWTTDELQEDFEVLGFMAPACIVRKRETKEKGTVLFVHAPRVYFRWKVT